MHLRIVCRKMAGKVIGRVKAGHPAEAWDRGTLVADTRGVEKRSNRTSAADKKHSHTTNCFGKVV